mmetsp:Transcript_6166/g.14354  ORF Transcript_6166/g.14354 Transcript_6166/m.14354 type:complete len:153 (+) Transcript_6166:37-495(+)
MRLVICVLLVLPLASGFLQAKLGLSGNHPRFRVPQLRSNPRPSSSTALKMCICVNCKWVDTCKAYHFVEEKHQQPHLSLSPDFMPRDGSPTMQAVIRKEGTDTPEHLASRGITVEYDVVECEDFVEEKGRWVKMMPKGTLMDAGFDPDFVPT